MTIEELNAEFRKKRADLSEEYRQLTIDRLNELRLDGLVRRKRDGRLGVLYIRLGLGCIDFDFYPITKRGKESERPDGFIVNVEDEFEPIN